MPDGLTPRVSAERPPHASIPEPSPDPVTHRAATERRAPRVVALQVVAILAGYAVAGVLCGLLWYWVWTPPPGTVLGGVWFPDPVERGLRAEFAGTGWYVVIALAGGLVVGAVVALVLDRSELAAFVAVVAGSVLAAWLMLKVGQYLGPADPHQLAATAADGTELPGNLAVARFSPLLCFPAGSLASLAAIYLLTPLRGSQNPGMGVGTRG